MTRTAQKPDKAGDTDALIVHFLETMSVTIRGGLNAEAKVFSRGDELEVTEEVVAAGLDRNGASWLDRLDDEPAQVERYGTVVFKSGPWPAGEPRWRRGDRNWADAREKDRKAAWALTDDEERARALETLERVYGGAPSSRTLNNITAGR